MPEASPAGRVYTRREIRCLARTIWFEARSEPLRGQVAVAEVVIARANDRRWRRDLCATVRMPNQFSFVRNGTTPTIDDVQGAQRMMDLARRVLSGRIRSGIGTALFYHADHVRPSWRHNLRRIASIGAHVFYRDEIRA